MSDNEKIILDIIINKNYKNIKFIDLVGVLEFLGFKKRIKGDHHIFYKDGIIEIINIQPENNMAKSYQIRQVRNILLKYNLVGDIIK